jgi:predicted DNA-binding WGR domain protein
MAIDMTRTDPERNMDRFYYVELIKDLFGYYGVHRQWGRRGANGHHRFDWYASSVEAQNAISQLVKQKLAKGYLLKMTATDL